MYANVEYRNNSLFSYLRFEITSLQSGCTEMRKQSNKQPEVYWDFEWVRKAEQSIPPYICIHNISSTNNEEQAVWQRNN